jgi:hypothetical protein
VVYRSELAFMSCNPVWKQVELRSDILMKHGAAAQVPRPRCS